MAPTPPLVTVLIPTYQRAHSLRRALDSVLSQDYPNVEIVISDNASTDGTEAMCRAYAEEHHNIRYIRRPVNVGATANFQGLRSEASGEYLAFLGDDDWFSDEYLSACVGVLEADQAVAVASGRAVYHHPDRVEPEPVPVTLKSSDGGDRVVEFYRRVRGNGIFYGVVRASVDARVGSLRNAQGADMVHVAERAYLGKVITSEHVSVNRAVGGATTNLANVARSLGLGRVETYAPQLAIVWWVMWDIAFASPVYADRSRTGRMLLSFRAGWAVGRRFLPEAAGKVFRLCLAAARKSLGTGRAVRPRDRLGRSRCTSPGRPR